MEDNIFDTSEPLPCLLKSIDDEEFQNFLDSLGSDIADHPPAPLLTPPPPDGVPMQLPEASWDPVCGPTEADGQEFENPTVLGPLLDCTLCILLREVVHTKDLHNLKLSIHGGINVFYHATVQMSYTVDGVLHAMEPSYVDFSTQSFEEVKQFLTEYGVLRSQDGFVVIQDSTSIFYDALCVRMNNDVANPVLNDEYTIDNETNLLEQGLCEIWPELDEGPITPQRSGIAAQRERTASLQLSDFADYFHLPIIDAAKEMNLCTTVLKRVCRKHGMARWPHRKIKSMDKKISKLQKELLARGGEGAVSVKAEIEKLRALKVRVCHGHSPS